MSYRCSIRPLQRQISKEVDATQRKMTAIACLLARGPGEDPVQYARRKGRHASKLAQDSGLWSKMWFDRALRCDGHVQRTRSRRKWNRSLRAFHDVQWLQQQRSVFAALNPSRSNPWTVFAGRTGTRAAPGRVQPRWQEAVQKVKDNEL